MNSSSRRFRLGPAVLWLIACVLVSTGCTQDARSDVSDAAAADIVEDGGGDTSTTGDADTDRSDAAADTATSDTADRADASDGGDVPTDSLQDTQRDAAADATADPGDVPDVADVVDPWFELGTGVDRFEPIVDGTPLRIVQGFQGGYHVWGSIRGAGFGPDGVYVDLSATDTEGEEVAHFIHDALRFMPVDGALEASGLTVLLSFMYADANLPDRGAEEGWSDELELCATVQVDESRSIEHCRAITVTCCDGR